MASSSEFQFLNETMSSIKHKLEKNDKRQKAFQKEFHRQDKLHRKRIMEAMPNDARERTKKLIADRYFFDDLMMGPPPKNRKLLRLNQFKRKSLGYVYDVPPLIDVLGTSIHSLSRINSFLSIANMPPHTMFDTAIRNEEEEFIKSCITKTGLSRKGKRELKLPQGWTERVLRLEGNPDHGKTYFVNEQTDELCIDKLPPGSSKLCGVVFGKFGTCFTQYNNVCTVEEIPRE